MTAISTIKTWHFQVNNTITQAGGVLATGRLLLFAIKNAFVGGGSWTDSSAGATTPTSNWTVDYSCDSVSYGTPGDGYDWWGTSAKLVWSGTVARSWIVLKNTYLTGGTLYLLIHLGNANAYNMDMYISYAGFTGGNTTSRPTALDETCVINNSAWGMDNGGTTNQKLHILKTSDNKITRVIISRSGWAHGYWCVETVTSTDGWTTPNVVYAIGSTSSNAGSSWTVMADLCGNYNTFGIIGGNPYLAYWETPFYSSATPVANQTVASELNSSWPAYPIELATKGSLTYTVPGASSASALIGAKGYAGRFTDIWWVPTQLGEGDQAPASGAKNFTVFGDICQPWNTTAVSLT